MPDKVEEGQQKVDEPQKDEKGNYPESVSWNQYVGIKESLGKKLDTATQKVTDLEEQVKKAVSTEEHTKIKTELDETKTRLQTTSDELKTNQDKSLSEKRDTLIKRGVSEDKVKGLSEKEIDAVLTVEVPKPAPDMAGGGGGSGSLGDMSPKDRVAEGDKRLREGNK